MRIVIPNYQQLRSGRVRVVALASCADEVRQILERQTLYDHAAAREDARVMQGRGPVYAVPFPGACGNVVVRHARRGGLLGRFVKDLFLSRLRPVRELITAYRLHLQGVPTPELVAYAMYPAGIFFRFDVVSREVEGAADLAIALERTADATKRTALLEAVSVLLVQLWEAGAHHADLNARNVLLTPLATGFQALVIDVDHVIFHVQRSPAVMDANLDRLARSLRKLAAAGLPVTEAEIAYLRTRAGLLQDARLDADGSAPSEAA